jgi:dienelactone hydrolase
VELDDFLIGKHEVTNREFKQFVVGGGYSSPQYWDHDVNQDDRLLSFEEAVELFRDRTGRPGPSTWEAGDFPSGEGDYPVAGVSWYEAAAYARFVGKQLPTIYQWNKAAGTPRASWIAPMSNYGDRGAAPVGDYDGMGPYGTFDMAGNVREWCVNAAGNRRFILGGGWNDKAYMFVDGYSQLPLDRSATNGIRVSEYLGDNESLAVASRPIDMPFRDFSTERPASDAEYEIFLRMYAYDATPLNASIEEESHTHEWTRQRITFDAAYGNERMMAYLWLPAIGDGPFQTVVHFPGSGAIFRGSIDQFPTSFFDYILKSGRAFMLPLYKGTYERGDDLDTDMPNESNAYRDRVVQWAKDLGRSIDYLETRGDIAGESLAYHGHSWGGRMGGLMVAIEPRFKTAILSVAGLKFQRAQPEADPFNFVPRITMPVLMLNGSLDHYFPLETSQRPMFRLLGTPPEHKRHVVEDGGHFVPRSRLISEVLDWLDQYLGPVQP